MHILPAQDYRGLVRLVGGMGLAVGIFIGLIIFLQPAGEAQADPRELGIELRAGSQDQPINLEALSPGVWTEERTLTLWWEPANNRPIKYRLRSEELQESVTGMARLVRVRVSRVGVSPSEPTIWEGLLEDLLVTARNRNSPGAPPSWPQVYVVSFMLSEASGNEFQGAEVEFKLVVDATQANNPGW